MVGICALYQKRTENGFFATEETENHGKEIPCPSVFSVAHKNDQFHAVYGVEVPALIFPKRASSAISFFQQIEIFFHVNIAS